MLTVRSSSFVHITREATWRGISESEGARGLWPPRSKGEEQNIELVKIDPIRTNFSVYAADLTLYKHMHSHVVVYRVSSTSLQLASMMCYNNGYFVYNITKPCIYVGI